jgi:transcriptional regulator with XRE-family HTH domain
MRRRAWPDTQDWPVCSNWHGFFGRGKHGDRTARQTAKPGEARARRPPPPAVPRLVAAGLEARSGVDQTTISRLERGTQRGLSIRRLAAILDALKVGDVVFDRPPTVRQTDLEIMLYGDRWARAVAEADRRLGCVAATTGDQPVPERAAAEPPAWFEDPG